jgi:hypothetical protein
VFGTIYDIGDASGPIAAGALVAWVGYSRMFQVMSVVAIAMAGLFSVVTGLSGRLKPDATNNGYAR